MALWEKSMQLQGPLMEQMKSLYGPKMPIEVRHYLSNWIESQSWSEVDPDNPLFEPDARRLFEGMLRALQELHTTYATNFILKTQLEALYTHMKYEYIQQPLELVRVMQNCLIREIDLVERQEQLSIGGYAGPINNPFGNLGMSVGQPSSMTPEQFVMSGGYAGPINNPFGNLDISVGQLSSITPEQFAIMGGETMQEPPGMQSTSHQQQGQPEPTSKSKHLFNKAMKEGHVKARNTVAVFVGAAGTGKTCSKHVLLSEIPPEVHVSTPMAERPVKVMKILTIDGMKWHRLSPDDQKEILAKFIVNIPAEADEVSNKKVSDKVASDKEATPMTLPDQAENLQPSVKASLKRPCHGNSLSAQSSKRPKQFPPDKSAGIEEVEALLESSTTETEFARLIELLSDSEAPLEVNLVYITDSGGQPQFHEVLPLFLRRTSVHIFVMKLSESLDERPLIKYFDDNGNIICEPYPAAHTNMQVLRHCIRTMQSQKFQKAAGKAPNLVFIGTHKDQEHLCSETREIKNQKLSEMLLPEFQDEVVYSNLAKKELIFPLNAKSPGEKEQKVAEEIRRLIMSMCTAEPDEIPLRWYCLELKLQEIAQALGRGVMSKEECFAVAQTLHFNPESFEAALQYLDELNIIFYYPDILPGTVFTDSQVLIAKATELVKFSYESRNKDAGPVVMARRGECQKFQDYALFTMSFLKSFNEHYIDNIFTPHDLVKLFRALLVFADFNDTEYFMPCLLQIISSEEVDKHRVCSSTATVPFVVHFPPGVPPLGIFCSLVVYLLSSSNHSPSPWKLKVDRSTTPVCLHRNCIEFRIPQYPGTITLIDSFAFFEVHVASSSTLTSQLCSHIREALLTGLKRAISNLGYNCQPEFAFLCSCSRESLHPASIGVRGCCWICSQDPDTYGDTNEKQQMWLPTTIASPPPPSSTAATGSGTSQPVIALSSPPPPSSTAATGSGTAHSKTGLDLEAVDGTTVLDEDDLLDVLSAVVDLAERWRQLGISLRLRSGDLKTILTDNPRSCSDCLSEMLTLWLKQNYKVERFGMPTWRRLVEAVEDHVGGNDHALAQRIARDNPGLDLKTVDGTTMLDEDDLRDVISAVVGLTKRWQELGVSLRLRQDDLKAILTNNPDSCDNCLREMLILWLGQKYKVKRFGKPTWRRLVEAVEDHVGGNDHALAQRIAREHSVHIGKKRTHPESEGDSDTELSVGPPKQVKAQEAPPTTPH